MGWATTEFENAFTDIKGALGETITVDVITSTLTRDSAGEVVPTSTMYVSSSQQQGVIQSFNLRQARDRAAIEIAGVVYVPDRIVYMPTGVVNRNNRLRQTDGTSWWVLRVDPFKGHDRCLVTEKGPREPWERSGVAP